LLEDHLVEAQGEISLAFSLKSAAGGRTSNLYPEFLHDHRGTKIFLVRASTLFAVLLPNADQCVYSGQAEEGMGGKGRELWGEQSRVAKGKAEIEDNPIEEPDDDAHENGQRDSPAAGRFHGKGDPDKDHDHAGKWVGQFCIEVNDISGGVIATYLDLPNITAKIIVTHLLGFFLLFLKDIGGFGNGDHSLLELGGLNILPFMKIPDGHPVKVPRVASPEGLFGVNSPPEFEIIIELKQGNPLERIVFGVEDLKIVNGIAASIPHFIVSNERLPWFLADFR